LIVCCVSPWLWFLILSFAYRVVYRHFHSSSIALILPLRRGISRPFLRSSPPLHCLVTSFPVVVSSYTSFIPTFGVFILRPLRWIPPASSLYISFFLEFVTTATISSCYLVHCHCFLIQDSLPDSPPFYREPRIHFPRSLPSDGFRISLPHSLTAPSSLVLSSLLWASSPVIRLAVSLCRVLVYSSPLFPCHT
jgi:hypothetical protein